jgi:hypothetical protein
VRLHRTKTSARVSVSRHRKDAAQARAPRNAATLAGNAVAVAPSITMPQFGHVFIAIGHKLGVSGLLRLRQKPQLFAPFSQCV